LTCDFPLYANPSILLLLSSSIFLQIDLTKQQNNAVTMKRHAPEWSQIIAAIGIPLFVIVALGVGFWRWRRRNSYDEV